MTDNVEYDDLTWLHGLPEVVEELRKEVEQVEVAKRELENVSWQNESLGQFKRRAEQELRVIREHVNVHEGEIANLSRQVEMLEKQVQMNSAQVRERAEMVTARSAEMQGLQQGNNDLKRELNSLKQSRERLERQVRESEPELYDRAFRAKLKRVVLGKATGACDLVQNADGTVTLTTLDNGHSLTVVMADPHSANYNDALDNNWLHLCEAERFPISEYVCIRPVSHKRPMPSELGRVHEYSPQPDLKKKARSSIDIS